MRRHSSCCPNSFKAALVLAIVTGVHWMSAQQDLPTWMSVQSQTTVATVATTMSKEQALPDWRLTTECSALTQDCVFHKLNQQRYAEYPFRFASKYESLYNWQMEMPEGWLQQGLIKKYAPFIRENHTVKSAGLSVQKCVTEAQQMSIHDQLNRLLTTLKRENNMVSFTISDYLYAKDMMQDVFEMAHTIVGFKDAFFMVAMDVPTIELACIHDFPFLAWPQQSEQQQQQEGALKKTVASAKFVISYELAKRRQSFFFFEMDVWFVKSPIPILQEHDEDIVFSGHQDNPQAANIGVYAVIANEATEEYLRICIEIMEQSPDTHDQAIMQQVYIFLDALQAGQPLEYRTGPWAFHHEPLPAIPEFKYRATHGRFLPYLIASDVRPLVVEGNLAIHTLCGAPLRNPHGKKMVAKELGAWYGSGSYYGKSNRYLWLDGHAWSGLSMAISWPGFGPWELYHDYGQLQWIIAATLALARRTGRIWVMPKMLFDDGVRFTWTLLDMESVESLGIEVRETNFPVNRKAWHNASTPFWPVARTAVGWEGKIFVQPRADSITTSGDILAWNSSAYAGSMESMFDAWFAIHTVIPELVNAQVLLAGLPASRHEFYNLQSKMRSEDNLTIAEGEIVNVWKQLRWCPVETAPPAVRFVADSDCYLMGKPIDNT